MIKVYIPSASLATVRCLAWLLKTESSLLFNPNFVPDVPSAEPFRAMKESE